MRQLLKSSYDTIIFIYLDSGAPDGPGNDVKVLNREDLAHWACLAVQEKKSILFVLDACHSTFLAHGAFKDATGQLNAQENKLLRESVGFLTSGDRRCLSSAICVSKEAGLVYLFSDAVKANPNNLEFGYRIRNSMFSRQLLSFWGHRGAELAGVTLENLPGHLNPPSTEPVDSYGFRAGVVGGHNVGLAARVVDSLFPLATDTSRDLIRVATQRDFAMLIPAAHMGGLPDDMRAFWTVAGDEGRYEFAFVEIATVNGNVTTVPRAAHPSHQLHRVLPATHPILVHLEKHTSARRNDGEDGPRQVPWNLLWWAFSLRVEQMKWRRGGDPPLSVEDLADLKGRLTTLNGEVPFSAVRYVYWMADYRRGRENDDEFFALLGQVRDRLLGDSADEPDRSREDGASADCRGSTEDRGPKDDGDGPRGLDG
jgi:hypothetical protein